MRMRLFTITAAVWVLPTLLAAHELEVTLASLKAQATGSVASAVGRWTLRAVAYLIDDRDRDDPEMPPVRELLVEEGRF
jgi:hypothetical protein